MSCYNYNQIYPLVWETILGSKLSDAPDDAEMFKIIRDVQYVDLGYACSMGYNVLGEYVFLMNYVEPGNVTSYVEKRFKRSGRLLEKFNQSFVDLNG